jgi:hypothetical protein
MSAFGPGDRVALRETPSDCGTVVEVLKKGLSGAELLLVNWDQHITGQIVDVALVACTKDDFMEQKPRA